MTVVPLDAGGLGRAAAALRAGEAIVVPFPSPLPYVVAGTTAAAVNEAKGRPREQPCGILVRAADVLPHLDLDEPTAALAIWIATVHRATLLVPVGPDSPPWLRDNAPGGVVGVTMAWLPELRPLAEEFGYLAVSSGNRTGEVPVATAAEADRVFAGRRLVLDGDAFRDPGVAHGSAAMIEVRRGGALRVVRDGVNNRSEPDRAAYLDGLRARFAATSP